MIFLSIIPMEKHNHCVVWCRLYRLNLCLVMRYVACFVCLKTFCTSDTESQFLKLSVSLVSFYYL